MGNPPETCKWRKFDGRAFWVEPSLCAYHCDQKITCKVWDVFSEGSKTRKKFTGEEEVVIVTPPAKPEVQPETKINRRRR